jgi:L-lactate dehydrogenase (cytochrome)
MTTPISVKEISRHNSVDDLWIVVDGFVYDLTEFAPEHPGGVDSMLCSKDPLKFIT